MRNADRASFDAIALHDEDGVATAIRALKAGSTAVVRRPGGSLTIAVHDDIPLCHKIAISVLAAGSAVLKHGQIIGRAVGRIDPGQHVHVHNLRGRDPAELL